MSQETLPSNHENTATTLRLLISDGNVEKAEEVARGAAISLGEFFQPYREQDFVVVGIRKCLERQDLEGAKKIAEVCSIPFEELEKNLRINVLSAVSNSIGQTSNGEPAMDPDALIKWLKDIGIPDEIIEKGVAKSFSFAADNNYDRLVSLRQELAKKYNLSEKATEEKLNLKY